MTKRMRQTFQEQHLAVRLVVYFVGLFIMTLGVSMSVKSNLGVSPVSSIPTRSRVYLVWKWEKRP